MNTRILVPLDGSELAECVIPYVKWFTKVSQVNEIVFMRIVEPLHLLGGLESRFGPEEREHIEQDCINLANDYLEKVAGQFKRSAAKVTTEVLKGSPAETISEYVENNKVSLIIMATHGHSGVNRWIRGSVADRILHYAGVPVLLIRPDFDKAGK